MTTALVIEDDDDIRRLLEVVLGQGGYQVRAAANSQDGLARLEEAVPDLLLVDVGLPDMDGYELVRRARPRVHGPIVMLSARSESSDESAGYAAGADAYLTKPFRPRRLLEDLRQIAARVAEHAPR